MEERWQEENLIVFNLKESDVYFLKFAFHSNQKVVLNANKKSTFAKIRRIICRVGGVCDN